MTRARTLLLAALACGGALFASGAPGDVQVRSWLSRTAVWPGDRVVYTIEIVGPPNLELVADDLQPDKLSLTGLEALSYEQETSAASAGLVAHRIRYLLTTYEVMLPSLKIGELPLRYSLRKPGQRTLDAAPADELRVKGQTLALRSTLPDDLAGLLPRDERAAARSPRWVGIARPLGLGLLILSAAPVALWSARVARRIGARRQSARARRRAGLGLTRSALEELRAVDARDDAARRAAYDRLDALLRQRLEAAASLPARALTAAELRARLQDGAFAGPGLARALDDCERARYAPPALLPAPDHFRDDLAALEELLAKSA